MKKSLFSSAYTFVFTLLLTLTSVMGWGQTFIMNNSSSLPTGWNKTARSQFVIRYAGQAQLQLYGPSGGVEGEVFTTFTFTNVTGISFNGTGSNAVTLTGLYSTDGIAWTSFGTVNIVKNSSSNSDYSYSDVSDLSGKTIYLKFRSSASSSYLKTITVTTSSSPCTTPSFSSNPSNSTISAGGNTSFSVLASNATSYQWQVNTGSTWSNISNGGVYSNATTSTLNVTGATTAMNGYQYRCVATNTGDGTCSAATASSPAATLTVNALPAPEINIKQGSTNVASGGSYNFGNQLVGNATSAVTFTIENTGNANLVLSGSPIVANSNTTDFTVNQTTTSTPVSGPGSTTFTVVFTPSGLGSKTATLSIANNDADEGTYTIVLNGTGVYSSASDIVDSGDTAFYAGTNNHLYANYQSTTITNTGGSVPVFRFQVRDGGAANNDTDDKPTTLTGLSFNYTGTANTIRAAALFNGNSKVADGTVTANEISFSGLSVEALDNANSAHITLRVTFGATVIDNEQLQFTVSSATADATGSAFGTSNAGGAFSSITGDRNRIEVVADRLKFTTQPSSTSTNTNLNFSIAGIDINENIDLDAANSITLSTSGVDMINGSPYSLSSGSITITNVQYSTPQNNITITANTMGLANSNIVTSNPFSISDVAVGTWETTGSGTWPTSSTSTWRQMTSSGWQVGVPSSNANGLLIIKHKITTNNNYGAADGQRKMIVENGGEFLSGYACTYGDLLVKSGGKFWVNSPQTAIYGSTGKVTIDSGGTLYLNSATLDNTDGFWKGVENFKNGSTVELQNWDWNNSGSSGAYRLIASSPQITPNSDGYYFGNLHINATPTDNFSILHNALNPGAGNFIKLTKNNLEITNNDTTSPNPVGVHLAIGGSNNTEIGGDIILNKGLFRAMVLGSSSTDVTVNGNIIINDGTFVINSQTSNNTSYVNNLNLKGNIKAIKGTLQSIDDVQCYLKFTGNVEQSIEIDPTNVDINRVNFVLPLNSNVKLLKNLKLNNNSIFEVQDGGVFNFNFDDADNPLLITNGALGTNKFESKQGSYLKITHSKGLVKATENEGNVQLSISNKIFSPIGTFHYIGKQDQETGDGIGSSSNGRAVIVDLVNNDILKPTVSFGVTNGNNTNINSNQGGILDIRKGKFVETETAYISGSTGALKMAADTYYKIVKGDSANPTMEGTSGGTYIPRMIGTYTLDGGTIELAGTGTTHGYQTLRSNKIYNNLTFSGGAIKTVSNSAMSDINGLVAVIDNTTLDVRRTSFNSFGKDVTTLRMYANSKFILDGAGTRPQLGGAYTLDPNSEIEFAGTAATQIRTQGTVAGAGTVNYAKVVVSGTNVTAGSTDDAGITFQNNGLFTVKTNATFKVPNKTGFTGSGTSSLKNADNLTAITLEPNSNIEYNRADDKDQSITTKINGTAPATYNYQNLIISGTGTKTPAEKDLIVNNVTNVSAGILQIPETLTETQNPYVLTSKKGIQVAALGQAIFGTNAQLMQDDGATNSGIVKVERKVAVPASAIPQFTYWSSPVVPEASASGTFFKTIFPGYTANALYYNEKNDRFYNSSGAFIQGRALAVQNPIAGGGALTAEMKGTPFNGSASFNMTMNGAGYNLVGNPYPSTISLQQLYTLNGGNINGNDENGKIDATFLLWDNTSNKDDEQYGSNYEGYSYSTYNAKGSGTGSPASNNGKKAEYGTASIGQGFMVRAIKQSDKVLTFDNSIRNSGKSVFFRGEGDSTKVDAGKFWLRLTTPKDRFSTIAVTYTKGASNALDNFDSKANGNSSDMLYSWLEDEKLVIQGRSFDFTQEDTVPLGMNNFESGSYTLSVWKKEGVFDVQQNIYIKDKLLNKVVNLSEGDYSFTSDSGVFTNRLEVVYKSAIVLGTEGITKRNVIVYREGNDFIVESEGSPILEVDCYDSAGRLVKKVVDHREKVALHAQDLPSGLYLLQIKHQQGTSVKRVLK